MADKTISDLTSKATVEATDIFEIEASGNSRRVTGEAIKAFVGGVGWTLVGSWTHSVDVANVDFTDLGGYTDLLVLLRLISSSVSDQRAIRLSTNNGSSFYSGASDYIQVAATGAEGGSAYVPLHDTATTAARSAIAYLPGVNVSAAPKIIDLMSRDTTGSRLFVASTDPVDAIRIIPGLSGNLTGGSAFVFGR